MSRTVDTLESETSNTEKSRSRCWRFTFNNPDLEPKDRFPKEWLYIYQLERGVSGTAHFQGAIYAPNAIAFSSVKETLPKANWGAANWRKQKSYCTKTESRIGTPQTNIEGLTWKPKPLIPALDLYDWEKAVMHKITEPPDDREIFWFYDRKGNNGKTTFARFLKLQFEYRVAYISGKAADMKFLLASRIEADTLSEPAVVLIDLPRTMEGHVSYQGIEEIKNGIFFSGKYTSAEIVMDIPHLFVFANFPPKFEAMSADRWRVIEL